MPWKTIGSIFILILIILFISFNLGQGFTTNISLIFTTFENIPVFLVVLISFTLGVLVTLPIAIFARKSRKHKTNADSQKQTSISTDKKSNKKVDAKAPPVYAEDDLLKTPADTKKATNTQKSETVNNLEKKAEK